MTAFPAAVLDQRELHNFDALYSDPGPRVAWARRHQRPVPERSVCGSGPGEPTAANSLRVDAGLDRPSPRFRVEETGISHMAILRTYGWQPSQRVGSRSTVRPIFRRCSR